MADQFKFAQLQPFVLAGAGTTLGATSIILSEMKDINGNALAMSDFGAIGYFTLEPGSGVQEEQGSFTGLTNNANGTTTLSGVKNVTFLYPYTETSGLTKTHPGGTKLVITNSSGYYNKFVAKDNDETINGTITFNAVPNSVNPPVGGTDLTNKDYVLSVVTGGTLTFNQVVVAGTAGETITIGQAVYLKESDGRWWLTDADTAATVDNVQLGIATGAGSAGVAITGGVLISGVASLTGLSANTKYYFGNTAGALSTSAGTTEVTAGYATSTTLLYFNPRYDQQLTENIQDALTPGGVYGTPSSSNPYLTKDYNASATGLPVVHVYTANTPDGSSTTQFDITNTIGTTYRYTFDGTGTDPNINVGTYPIGTVVDIQGQNFAAANKGLFVTTGVGANYFEVTNATPGTVESNKTIGTGYLLKGAVYTKPAGLKYITVEQVGAGAAGDGTTSSDSAQDGGASAGYAKKLLATSVLASTINYVVGYHTIGTTTQNTNIAGRTIFNHATPIITTGATGSTSPGTSSGGDINITGQKGVPGIAQPSAANLSGAGGSTMLGLGGIGTTSGDGGAATGYGAGGGGGDASGTADVAGGNGTDGIMIITEFFS